ncbi:response regulator [Methanococcoides sp. LMO-2]|uniref:Response regulator n=1 Tax=Methanococcoides cohabitans TaxID=3136559 RepID=A0ABU9KSJ4_9EURY
MGNGENKSLNGLGCIMKYKKIFIVEDQSSVASMFKLMLEAKGYFVTGIVSKGENVISLLETTNPDLVIMDIWLKGSMDGIEAAMKIRNLSSIPIVFVTADYSIETRKRADLVDYQAYLKKPIRYEHLAHIINSIFDGSVDCIEEENATKPTLCKV